MKKTIICALILTLTLTSAGFGNAAEATINVKINGNDVVFDQTSGAPFIDENNRTQVPFRKTLEAFGADVKWDADTRTAIAVKDDITVKVPIGADYIYKNDDKVMNDTQAIIRDGKTYLPIRVVLEAFGAEVGWDAASNTVTVTTAEEEAEESELEQLAREILESMNNISSMNISMSANVQAQKDGKTSSLNSNMKLSAFYDPPKIRYTGTMTRWGNRYAADLYIIPSENSHTKYVKTGSKYEKTEGGMFSTEPYVESVKSPLLIGLIPQFEQTGSSTVDGVRVIKYEGLLSQFEVMSILSPADMIALTTEELSMYKLNVMVGGSAIINVTEAEPDFRDVKSIKVAVYIDPEAKHIMKYNMNLLPMFKKMLETGGKTVVEKAVYEVTVSDVDKVKDFSLPAGVPAKGV